MKQPGRTGIDAEQINAQLKKRKNKMKLSLGACARCTLCADSCFLFHANHEDPTYMPSYKVINSIGRLYKRKGRITRPELEQIQELVWNKCVLCTRCYCPFGIDIPDMIAFARSICRSQNVLPKFGQ
ncbi:MAG: (Fe-S)-binding protein [Desulfobacteraceae bacterium]